MSKQLENKLLLLPEATAEGGEQVNSRAGEQEKR
jgi:hypothetical protein